MDTFDLAQQAVEGLGLAFEADRLAGRLVVPFNGSRGTVDDAYQIVVETAPEEVLLRAPQLAGTGGPGGMLEPGLAALAAAVAWDYGVLLGVDTRDGEIEARVLIPLAFVPADQRTLAIRWALRDFLQKQRLARSHLWQAREAAATQKLAAVPLSA